VTFLAAQDRHVGVTYTIAPTGYFPAARFSYILETGAGWRESIGSVDIIVQLPYDASVENVLPELEGIFQSWTTPNGRFFGNEIRWHWDNLEPSARDNFSVTVLAPSVWQVILDARAASAANPTDAIALVELVHAYNDAVTSRFPAMSRDPFAILSEETYARAIALQPDSAELHADFAWLLWEHLAVQAPRPVEDPAVQHILREVGAALALDPQNARATALLGELEGGVVGEWALPTPSPAPTVTDAPASPTSAPPTVTATVANASPTVSATLTPSVVPATATQVPAGLAPIPIPAQPASDTGRLILLLGLIAMLAIGVVWALLVVRRRQQG
jgi:hypothetical protein